MGRNRSPSYRCHPRQSEDDPVGRCGGPATRARRGGVRAGRPGLAESRGVLGTDRAPGSWNRPVRLGRVLRALPCVQQPGPPLPATPGGDAEEESSFDFIFTQVVYQLEFQNQLWDVVDGRLRLVLGAIGIILVALLQGLTRGLEPPRQPLAITTGAAAILAVALFLV